MMYFFSNKKASRKGYMEMIENFYLEILWECSKSIHLSLLIKTFLEVTLVSLIV